MITYILHSGKVYEEVDESTYFSLMGDENTMRYATQVYRGLITLYDVPEEYRESVNTIVNNKIVKWGTYNSQNISVKELIDLVNDILRDSVSRGTVNELFQALKDLRDNATDDLASTAINAYPRLKYDNTLIKSGTRINWNGQLKRATVDLYDTNENNPDNAPTLWENINYKDGYRIIPEVITVGAAFSKGEKGWWNDVLYESVINNNVWTPDQYSTGWSTPQ